MHRELVIERDRLTEKQIPNALPCCKMLPGPAAIRLSAYAGWRLRGAACGLIADLLFVLLGSAARRLLATIQIRLGMLPIAYALFFDVKATAIGVVTVSFAKLPGNSPLSLDRWVVATLSFIAIFAFGLHLPVVIEVAAVFGAAIGVGRRRDFSSPLSVASRKDALRDISIWARYGQLLWHWFGQPDSTCGYSRSF